ncbi:MAG: hypothetical protein ABSC50_05715 [Candidatus Bathyarchaeia archaeon]|jgi:hypothetical protein
METEPIGAMSRRKWQQQTVDDAIPSLPHPVPDADYTLQAQYKTKEPLDTKPNSSNEPHLLPNAYSDSDAFGKLLSDSIDETMTDLLGIRVREAVYDFMERKYSVARNEISQHLDELFKLFENNFGVASGKVIGRAFAKKVYSKLEWDFIPLPNFEFADYIDTIKTRIGRELLDRTKSAERSGI